MMNTLVAVFTYFGGAAHLWHRLSGNGSGFNAVSPSSNR